MSGNESMDFRQDFIQFLLQNQKFLARLQVAVIQLVGLADGIHGGLEGFGDGP